VVFAGSVAIGAASHLRGPGRCILWKFEQISGFTFIIGVLAVALMFLYLRYKSALILNLFSPELAAATASISID